MLNQVRTLLRLLRKSQQGIIDLSCEDFVFPLVVLPLAALISKNVIKYKPPANKKYSEYLRYFHFPGGLDRFEYQSSKYLPIYNFDSLSKNLDSVKIRSEIISNLIEIFISHIGMQRGIKDSLELSIDEIISNIEEHSGARRGWIHAQYYPNKQFLDICITDTGIGLSGSYKKSGIAVTDDSDALQKALLGESVKPELMRGSGIRTFVNIVCKGFGGEAIIVSGKALAYATRTGVRPFTVEVGWEGTVIGLRVPRQNRGVDYSLYID